MKKFILLLFFLFFCSIVNAQVTFTVGTLNGTDYNTYTQYPAAYGRLHESTHQQILISASEMAIAGCVPGTITALGFKVQNPNACGSLPNYTIKMKTTTATNITAMDNSGLTQVYTVSSFTPVTGWNTHTFSTQFLWNGSSNILIDLCNSVCLPPITNSNASGYFTYSGFDSYVIGVSETVSQCASANTTQYTQVRPTIQLTIIPNTPSCAIISSPADGADSLSRATTLSWTNGGNTTNYDVYFGTSSNPPFVINKTSTTYNPGTLSGNTDYYWKIVAKNSYSSATGCSTWTFNTNSGRPYCPTNPTPSIGATNVPFLPTLSWTASAGATRYRIYFGTSPNPPLIDSTTSTSYVPATATGSYQTYYWRISPKGSYEYREGCDVWNFTTYHGCTSNISPPDGSTSVVTYPTLNWTAIPATIKYYIYLGTSSNPPLIDSTANTSYLIQDLLPNTTYYWKIVPRTSSGFPVGCSIWNFTTNSPVNWFVKASGNDALSGNCWDNAKQDLSLVLLNAASGDTIHVAAGTYYPTRDTNGITTPAYPRSVTFALNSGVKMLGGYPANASGADLASSLLVPRDYVNNLTVLSGDLGIAGDSSDNCYNVIRMRKAVQGTSLLDGFTITRGYANGSGTYLQERGAGIYMTYAKLNMSHCILTKNRNKPVGNGPGGGIYNEYGNLQLSYCTVSNNVSSFQGGGIYSIGNGSLTIEYSTFYGNKGGSGDALCGYSSSVSINNSTFWNNSISDVEVSTTYGAIINNSTIKNFRNGGTVYANANNSLFNNISYGNINLRYCYSGKYYYDGAGTSSLSIDGNLDLWLRALASNGGLTQTCALDTVNGHNPVVGYGDPAFAGLTDQRGVIRHNPPCMGAYEVPYAVASDIIAHDTMVCSGNSIALHVSTSTIANPIFCWFQDSLQTLLLHKGDTYIIPPLNSSVDYYVTVHNGSVYATPRQWAKKITVYVVPAPIIISQPVNTGACMGTSATFSVQAMGLGLTYQWKKGNNVMLGQNSSSLTINNVQYSDTGNYSCLVTSSCGGQIITDVVKLSLGVPFAIITHPQSANICLHGNAVLGVAASGIALAYQWQKNGINLAGRTHDTLMIIDAQSSQTGNYTCKVSSPCGVPVISNVAAFTVHAPVCSISGMEPYYCTSNGPVILHGVPGGGVFSGDGISDSTFYPSLAGAGAHLINYNYSDPYSCQATFSQIIPVEVCQGTLPQCATIVYPYNGIGNIPRNVSLSWAGTGNTVSYDVYFGTSITPPFRGNQTNTTYTPASLLSSNTYYYWKIVSKNSNGSASSCNTWSFKTTTSTLPDCIPNYTYPTNNAIDIPLTPVITWPASSLATRYRVYLGTSPNPPLIDSTINPTYTANIVTLPNTVYYWKIVPRSSVGYVSGCNTVWSFTTSSGCAALISPLNGSTGLTPYPVLSWNAVQSAIKYYICCDTVPNPSIKDSVTGTSYNADLLPNKHYYWKVIIRNASGYIAGCPVESFSTVGNNRHWFVKTTGNDTAAGDCWNNAKRNLTLVMLRAQVGDTIHVAQGKYIPDRDSNNCIMPVDFRDITFSLYAGVRLIGGYPASASGSDLHSSLQVVRNPKLYETILSGDIGAVNDSSDNAYHVVYMHSRPGGSAMLDGFTITKGMGTPSFDCSDFRNKGAGIFIRSGKLYVKNSLISLNTTRNTSYSGCGPEGAGIYSNYADLIVVSSLFLDNYGSYGHGIYSKNGTLDLSYSSAVNSICNNCCFYCNGTTNVYINNCTAWETVGQDLSTSNATITNCTFGEAGIGSNSTANNCIIGSTSSWIIPRYTFFGGIYYDGNGNQNYSVPQFSLWLDAVGYYGGPTPTKRLKPYNNGNPAAAKGNPAFAGMTDQRGVLRANPPCVGAYEGHYATASDIQINDTAICPGNSVTLTATTTLPNPTIKWYSNSYLSALVYTGSTFTTPVLNSTVNYWLVVYNDSTFSNPQNYAKLITVYVSTSMTIDQQPQSVAACSGGSATFNVGATGAGITYQWEKNNVILSGDTNSTLVLNNITSADTGTYFCHMTNTCGSQLNTNNVTLSIGIPVTITAHPQSTSICQNDSSMFVTTAQGTGVTCQWQKNGSTLIGQTNDTLLINNATISDSGTYTCVVNGVCGGPLLSQAAHLSVTPNVSIVQSPSNTTKCIGDNHIFNVTANGFNLGYQWKKNGLDMIGRISDTLMLNHLSYTDTGTYSCAVNGFCGSQQLTSNAHLSISNTTGSILGLNSLYCTNSSPSSLGGIPSGGTFSGPGIAGNVFDPNIAGPGIHQIIYDFVDSYSCSGSVTSTVSVSVCTYVEDIIGTGIIEIYPNPVSDELIVSIVGNKETIDFEIYNSVGQIVFTGKVIEKTLIPTEGFSRGVYIIKLKSGRTVICRRIVKE